MFDWQPLRIPLHLPSRSNMREHWAKRHKREREIRGTVAMLLTATRQKPELPTVVILERLGARMLDDDNLRGAMKAVRDGVADWLGVDDADERVTWLYRQHAGKERAAVITMRARGTLCPHCGQEMVS